MAYGYGSTHSSSINLTVYIVRRFLMILRNKLRFAPYATMSDIPVRAGHKVARWTLPVDIGTATTAIAEFASANEVATLTWSKYEGTVSTYGTHSKISDLTDASWLPQAKNMLSNVFAYSAAKTIDTLLRNDADDTTSFIISGETTNNTGTLASTETMTAQDVAVTGGFFDEKDCEGFDSLGGNYALIVHGEPAKDMQIHVEPGGATSGVQISWHDTQKYTVPGQRKLARYEIGQYAGVSVQKSNNIATSLLTGTITAFKNIGLSKDAIGRANLDMRNARIIVIPPGRPDKSDPLNLYGTIGWKWRAAHRPLDVNNRGVILYTAK